MIAKMMMMMKLTEEERVIPLVQLGEDLLGHDDQRKGLEELKKDQGETVQPEELSITTETHKTSHIFNEHNSSTSSLSLKMWQK